MHLDHVIVPLDATEAITITLLVLVLFGARKLPLFSRNLGKSMTAFNKARKEFESGLFR